MQVRRRVVSLMTVVALSLPGVAQAATLGAMDQDGVNLRSGPGLQFSTVGAIPLGQSLQVVAFQGDWVQVKATDGSLRWAANWVSVIKMASNELVWARTTDSGLRLRAQPDGQILSTLGNGERLQVLEMNGYWWRVRRDNGQEGWAHKSYLRLDSTAPMIVTGPGNPGGDPGGNPGGIPGTPGGNPGGTPGSNPGGVSSTPPAAPAESVAVIGPLQTTPQTLWGAYQAQAIANGPIYQGRSPVYYDWTGSINAGETLSLLDSAEGWVKVRTPRAEVGWVPGNQVSVAQGALRWQVADGKWGASFAAGAPPVSTPTQEIRLVRDNDGLRLRANPTVTAPILGMLGQNARLTVLQRQAPWIQVRLDNGQVGWVWEEYTIPAPAAGGAPGTPAPATNRPSISLNRVKEGVVQVTINAPNSAIGNANLDGTTLSIPFQTGLTDLAGLPINTSGLRSVRMDANGLKLDLLQAPEVKTVAQVPGTLVLELRTTLAGLSWREAADRSVLTLSLKGSLFPVVTEQADGLSLSLPGATLAAGATAPMGVGITPTADGLTLKVASKRAYALKRTATGFELHLYKPGLAGKLILLDPGHGGGDSGASANGVLEKVVNLETALRVRAMLASKGATVKMTRIADPGPAPAGVPASLQPDLLWRSRMANETGVDLFLSIHHNSGSSAAKGVEAFYSSTTLNPARSRQFANLVYQGLIAAGQVGRYVKDDQYYVNRNTEAPNSLVEIAYLTNPDDAARARDPQFQDRAAAQIVKAMEQFWAERP